MAVELFYIMQKYIIKMAWNECCWHGCSASSLRDCHVL